MEGAGDSKGMGRYRKEREMEREGKNAHQMCRGEGREGLDEAEERRAGGRGWLKDFRDGEEAVAGQARQVGAGMWREEVWRREKVMEEIS